MASTTRVSRLFHAALHSIYRTARRPWTRFAVCVRYNGYRFGALRWCPNDGRYRLGLDDARTDGVFALDQRDRPDQLAAYALVLNGHVEQLFDASGRPMDWVGWRPGERPFYRDDGF
jgi:hypothetical protein